MRPPRRKPSDDTEQIELWGNPRESQPQRFAFSKRGMVSTAHHRATDAGVRMLAAGGNAIDAAVASAFALGVCEPQASGLGGQTMMVVHIAEPRSTFALDGSSRAPNRATRESMTKKERRRGHRATTVPTTPATLAYALDRYGKLPLAKILEPSIELAEEGFHTSALFHALSKRELANLKTYPAGSVFLKSGRRPFPVGSELRQPALAKTLRRLAAEGIEDFYTGEIARAIHDDMSAHEGLLHADDLAQIPWPVERKPISARFENHRVLTMPPPGSGPTLVRMLNLLEEFPTKRWTTDDPKGAALLVEIIRRSAVDRRDRPFDPTYHAQDEDSRKTKRENARITGNRIRRKLRAAMNAPRPPKTQGETTHLSVMDADGNAVALTQSIERVFGSFALTPELGFLYNNYMTAFEYEDMSHPYYMRPNAAPWASVAPTIVFRGQRPWLAIGSPGSERIVSAILQVLLRLRTQSPADAVAAPRLHCSVAGRVSIEASRFRDDIPDELARLGYEIDERDPYSFYLGCVALVLRERHGFTGVADPRRDGSAGGPRATSRPKPSSKDAEPESDPVAKAAAPRKKAKAKKKPTTKKPTKKPTSKKPTSKKKTTTSKKRKPGATT